MLHERRNCNLSFPKWWGWVEPQPVTENRQLKSKLQTELNRTATAGSDDWVGGRHIRCGARAPERSARRVVVRPSVLSAEWVGEVGMVEDVEELSAKLGTDAPAPLEVLGH